MLRFIIVWREDEYKGRLSPLCRSHNRNVCPQIPRDYETVDRPSCRNCREQLNELVPGFDLDDIDEESSSIPKMNGESIDTMDNDDFLKSILAMDFLDN